jgi:5-methylcytosine-specific restriction protein A
MPQRIATGCKFPGGCAAKAVKRGYCVAHAQMQARMYDGHRGSSSSRGYGYRWSTQTRPRILRRDPLCRDPFGLGCEQESRHVDHVIPKDCGGPDADWNLQGLCAEDHSRKTLLEQSVRFNDGCQCVQKDMCWSDGSIVYVACRDHAPQHAEPINKWPQVVCLQRKGQGGVNFLGSAEARPLASRAHTVAG